VPYVFVPLIVVVIAALAWSWWTARSERDPASSVDSFHRALTAMQPGMRADAPAVEEPAEDRTDVGGDGPLVTAPQPEG
jgi:hypothetical protein